MRTLFVSFIVLSTGLLAADASSQGLPIPDSPRHGFASRPGARYQGRGAPEQTDRFSRKIKLGRNGLLTLSNFSGAVVVTAVSGDDLTIEAVKRTRGDRSQLDNLRIEVEERAGRADVRTVSTTGNVRSAAVDYTVTIPSDASVELRSISGDIRVTGVQGTVRAESVSGNVTTERTPRLERVKSVSGNVDLVESAAEGELAAGTVSGNLRANGLKLRGLDLNTVSGDVTLANVVCDHVSVRSVSGNVEYAGPLARNGRYDINSHSGTIRLAFSGNTGFELRSSSFSGSIRSEFPLTLGADAPDRSNDRRGDRPDRSRRDAGGHSTRATYGDASAVLTIRTFSGDVSIVKEQASDASKDKPKEKGKEK